MPRCPLKAELMDSLIFALCNDFAFGNHVHMNPATRYIVKTQKTTQLVAVIIPKNAQYSY
jgi:hypothetical protein